MNQMFKLKVLLRELSAPNYDFLLFNIPPWFFFFWWYQGLNSLASQMLYQPLEPCLQPFFYFFVIGPFLFFWVALGLNSGPCVCVAGILQLKPMLPSLRQGLNMQPRLASNSRS
jgi:hypothetical protein